MKVMMMFTAAVMTIRNIEAGVVSHASFADSDIEADDVDEEE